MLRVFPDPQAPTQTDRSPHKNNVSEIIVIEDESEAHPNLLKSWSTLARDSHKGNLPTIIFSTFPWLERFLKYCDVAFACWDGLNIVSPTCNFPPQTSHAKL